MKIFTRPIFTALASVCFLAAAMVSCTPDEESGLPPELKVTFADSSAISDTSTEAGHSIDIIIEGLGNDNNITYFALIRNGVHVLDSGLNAPDFVSRQTIIRGIDSIEDYIVLIRDRDFNESTFSFSIGLKPTLVYGDIASWPHIILGAQNNSSVGSFLDLFTGNIYNLPQAFLNQGSVQMLYFYDAADLNTIASPNANIDTSYFGGSSGLANWTVKNEIRYIQLFYTEQEFLDIDNDSLIIANLFPYATGKRKAKSLQAGHMYEFCFNGIYGIFYVNSVSGTDAGTIDISIKMQQ
ncbi:hypothetical protein SDC9_102420 [bioreactor metagenome]|uniref:Uncharacterized protein n=1 Tax=bioreactor metagenome TaxID=1076179 RepID=A0A645AXJ1_9ZZZZ